MQYALLKATHDDYDLATWTEISLFYEGGYKLLKHVGRFLPKYPNEPELQYKHRLQTATYINTLCEIVDFFTAHLFEAELTIAPPSDADRKESVGQKPKDEKFYQAFGNNCDRKGTPFSGLIHEVVRTALLKKKALIAVDYPSLRPGQLAPQTLAEEEASGLSRAYCFELPVEQLIDWEIDDDGRFKWAMIRRHIVERPSPREKRAAGVEEFKLWEMNGDRAHWSTYRVESPEKGKEIPDDKEIPVAAEGDTSFKSIPIVQLDLPIGLWVGNKIGLLAKAHFRRGSMLTSSEDRSLCAIPVISLGSEIGSQSGELPSELQQDPNRGGVVNRGPVEEFKAKGWVVLGRGDTLAFASPDTSSYALVGQELQQLVDDMHRVTHQMAMSIANTTSSLGRSGMSKMADQQPTKIVLAALGEKAANLGIRVYDVVGHSRDEHVAWTAHGLDHFDVADRAQLLNEAVQEDMINIPSQTYKKHRKMQLASGLVGDLPPSVQDQIRKEIEEGVEAELELKERQHEAMEEGMNQPAKPEGMPAMHQAMRQGMQE